MRQRFVLDTTAITDKAEALSLFSTEEFQLTDKSDFSFNLKYASKDKSEKTALSDEVSLNVVLVDAKTNKAIGLLKKASSKNITEKGRSGLEYKVNTKGIGNKMVKLLVELDSKSVDNITIAKTTNLKNRGLEKKNQIEVAFNETLGVSDYALSQNYPNPFNPSTTIKYQIPNDGMVSLRIYDITGQEVKTLVNQAQEMGRYEVSFNASNLSSGVYFYRIQSGSFTKTMKMLLLK